MTLNFDTSGKVFIFSKNFVEELSIIMILHESYKYKSLNGPYDGPEILTFSSNHAGYFFHFLE